MSGFTFIVIALAVRAIIDCWFNGSIFNAAQQRLDARRSATLDPDLAEDADDIAVEPQPANWVDRIPDRLVELLTCWFCLSYQVSAAVVLGCWLMGELVHWSFMVPIYVLAVAEVTILFNVMLPEELQYDRSKPTPVEENNDDCDPGAATN